MSKKAYNPCLVSCMVYTYLILNLILIGVGIASFIISSDVVKNTDHTICTVNKTLTELFDGTESGITPVWSGVDNFNTYATQISTNFPNTIPTLDEIFTSTEYQTATSTSSGSVYDSAIAAYNCPTSLSSSSVTCPFANSSSCVGSSSTQVPQFSSDFCETSVNTSAAAQI